MMDERTVDRIRGVVFGTAIGDALGYPVEFLSRQDIWHTHGAIDHYVRLVNGVAQVSDDTQMFRAVLEGLLDSPEIMNGDAVALTATPVARRLVQWLRSPDNTRAPGRSCLFGCDRLEQGVPWWEAGREGAGGCGVAMRSMAYGILFPPERAGEVAGMHGLMTHRSTMPQASGAAVAAMVSSLIRSDKPLGEAVGDGLRQAVLAAASYDEGTAAMLVEAGLRARQALNTPTGCAPLVMEALDGWRGWLGHEAVAAAILCFLVEDGKIQEVMKYAVGSSGDSDSIGAIAGAFCGALRGFSSFPAHLTTLIEDRAGLQRLADRAIARFFA